MANSKDILEEIFDEVGLPVVIGSWGENEVAKFPFLEYHIDETDNLHADGRIYQKIDVWQISVYGKLADMKAYEDTVEATEKAMDDRSLDYYATGNIFFDDCVYCEFSFSLLR